MDPVALAVISGWAAVQGQASADAGELQARAERLEARWRLLGTAAATAQDLAELADLVRRLAIIMQTRSSMASVAPLAARRLRLRDRLRGALRGWRDG